MSTHGSAHTPALRIGPAGPALSGPSEAHAIDRARAFAAELGPDVFWERRTNEDRNGCFTFEFWRVMGGKRLAEIAYFNGLPLARERERMSWSQIHGLRDVLTGGAPVLQKPPPGKPVVDDGYGLRADLIREWCAARETFADVGVRVCTRAAHHDGDHVERGGEAPHPALARWPQSAPVVGIDHARSGADRTAVSVAESVPGPKEPNTDRWCATLHAGSGNICTRTAAHVGEHVSHGTVRHTVWPQSAPAEPRAKQAPLFAEARRD